MQKPNSISLVPAPQGNRTLIVHNHPIHYKNLLFFALAHELDFIVLFVANRSRVRLERPLPTNGEYRYEVALDVAYEELKPLETLLPIWRSCAAQKPSVVIISGYCDTAAWTAWAWACLNRAKIIIWAESNRFDRPKHWAKEWLKRLFISRCHLAHVYGASNRDYMLELGLPSDRIFVKRAVADVELFSERLELPPKPPHKTMLYVGRFSAEKNLEGLIRAFRRMKQDAPDNQMVLELVGYGPLEDHLRKLVSIFGLSGSVRFRGQFKQSALPPIFQGADVFVLPSLSEPWGLVVNEAMLSGLPVAVSSRCGCAADLVNAETGWSFAPEDEVALARLLGYIDKLPRAALQIMGRSAAILASAYSPSNCAKIVAESVRALDNGGQRAL